MNWNLWAPKRKVKIFRNDNLVRHFSGNHMRVPNFISTLIRKPMLREVEEEITLEWCLNLNCEIAYSSRRTQAESWRMGSKTVKVGLRGKIREGTWFACWLIAWAPPGVMLEHGARSISLSTIGISPWVFPQHCKREGKNGCCYLTGSQVQDDMLWPF